MGKIQTKSSHGSRDANQMSSAKRLQHPGSIPGRSDIVSPLHRAAYKIVPGAPPRGSCSRNLKLTTHSYVKSRARIRGSLPPFPHALWRARGLTEQTDNYTCLFFTRWLLSSEHRKALSYSLLPDIRNSVFNTLRTGFLNCLNARSRGLTFRHRASSI